MAFLRPLSTGTIPYACCVLCHATQIGNQPTYTIQAITHLLARINRPAERAQGRTAHAVKTADGLIRYGLEEKLPGAQETTRRGTPADLEAAVRRLFLETLLDVTKESGFDTSSGGESLETRAGSKYFSQQENGNRCYLRK